MSSGPNSRERLGQKLRTRALLLRSARELVDAGRAPTVAVVADAAMVSRATAYRYFPSQDALLAEIPLDLAAPTVGDLFGDEAPADPEDRVALVHNALYDLSRDHEYELRLFLRASLARPLQGADSKTDPFRGARRAVLLAEALTPLEEELSTDEVERLKASLAMLVGGEAMIVLRDVLRLEHDKAREVGEWAVRQMVRAARRHPRSCSRTP